MHKSLSEIKALYDTGLSYPKIAERLGIPLSTIHSRVRRAGIKGRPAHTTNLKCRMSYDELMVAYKACGFNASKTDRYLGLPIQSVNRNLRRMRGL